MRILVIGEVCVDEFVYGKIDRICPEAPVPVLNPIERVENPGMAGNTVANLKALVPNAQIGHIHQNEPIRKTRFVEKKSNQMVVRVDDGEVNLGELIWTPAIDVMIAQADIVVVSDYNKGFLNNAQIKEIAKKSTLSIIDSKRKLTNDIIEGYSFVKLNEKERLNNPTLTTDNIITTLGSEGAEYQNILFPSPNPQETIDVSGAGDTFVASFISKYFTTKDVRIAIKFANEMAAQVVSKKGVVVPVI